MLFRGNGRETGQEQKKYKLEKERKQIYMYVQTSAFTHSVDIEADHILSLQQNDDPSFPSISFVGQCCSYCERLSIVKENACTHHVRDETKVAHHRYFVVHCQGQQRCTRL